MEFGGKKAVLGMNLVHPSDDGELGERKVGKRPRNEAAEGLE